MKKVILLLCAACIVMSAIGCGSKPEDTAGTPKTTTDAKTPDGGAPAGGTTPVETK